MKKICLFDICESQMDNKIVHLAYELSQKYKVYIISSQDRDWLEGVSDKITLCCLKDIFGKSFSLGMKEILYLRRYLRLEGIDLVLSVGAMGIVWMLAATLGTPIKRIFYEQLNQRAYIGKRNRWIRRLGVWLSHKVVTLTEEDKGYILYDYRIPAHKVLVIPHWIDGDILADSYEERSQRIITVGPLCHQKGYDLLLQVAEIVLKEEPGWVWDIYGDGDLSYQAKLVQEARDRGIEDKIFFHKELLDKAKMYEGHSMYVMTSYYEGLPQSLLDASRYRLPLIAFRVPSGIDEMIEDGLNGELIENLDVKQMAHRLVHLIHYPRKRISYANQSWVCASKFDKQKLLQRWWILLGELIGE